MRKGFEAQLSLGQTLIEDSYISPKSKHPLDELLKALKMIYCNKSYSERIFEILETHLMSNKKKTGRTGMNLWIIFVLSQVRLCLNTDYCNLHNLANNHKGLRQVLGVHFESDYSKIQFEYQNIYDNVTMLSDELIKEINVVVLEFGQRVVFKKKENTALRLKTDSFVVESNVHFPTDYNLLWDCSRKCLDAISKHIKKHKHQSGWRKLGDWRYKIKGLMRELGKASASGGKNKQQRIKKSAKDYLSKTKSLLNKIQKEQPLLPIDDMNDLMLHLTLDHFTILMKKHIDLIDRRILKGETIPHSEKLFSVFESFTEWIKKGKSRPNVELGKKLSITTDQYNLIVDYELLTSQQDREIVIDLADRMIRKYKIRSWSFDKGYWSKDNKELLQLEVSKVIMPKLGRRNKAEEIEENSKSFKRLKNKHSAIESNINELEQRGLDRCPDRGINNYKRYVSLGVCAYNLKKIGRELLRQQRKQELKEAKKRQMMAA
jgi:hypothetical protein